MAGAAIVAVLEAMACGGAPSPHWMAPPPRTESQEPPTAPASSIATSPAASSSATPPVMPAGTPPQPFDPGAAKPHP
ncbi:MAG: hypothetical protein HY898_15320 [Deltaproteobacteria bacterium]|nr:hypothetical protein [Deltaproteobacteria bacterium]